MMPEKVPMAMIPISGALLIVASIGVLIQDIRKFHVLRNSPANEAALTCQRPRRKMCIEADNTNPREGHMFHSFRDMPAFAILSLEASSPAAAPNPTEIARAAWRTREERKG